VNPDYKCWLSIEGTVIDYPVVRADDNEKYLNLTFFGEENKYGALFMDYRCDADLTPHIIIYGHNTKDGDIFGGLRNFLNAKYVIEHPVIELTADGEIEEYEIFAARKTKTDDLAYFIDFGAPGSFEEFAERCGAPEGTKKILTLSTCVSGNDKDERVIVQASLR
jgi:sortase B